MTKKNLTTLIAGLLLGATLMALHLTPEPKATSTDPVVIGHRINSLGDSQLVYAKN